MPSTVVLDSSVLLSAGRTALYSFGASNVVLPLAVIRDLEAKRSDPDLGHASRSILRELDSLRSGGDLTKGVSLGEGYGTIHIFTNNSVSAPLDLIGKHVGHSEIIAIASALKDDHDTNVTISTKNVSLKVLAETVGIGVTKFVPTNLIKDFIDKTETVLVSGDVIDQLHKDGQIQLFIDVPRNAGVIFRNELDDKHTCLAISGPNFSFSKVKQHTIAGLESRSAEQALAIDYLMDESVKIVSLGGRAGTGKTTLALAAGVEQVNAGKYKRIIVFRSMHAVGGEELGFLPGDEGEKFDPWVSAIYDALDFMDKVKIQTMKSKGLLQVMPLTHIRGRTFKNAFIIIDESQNLSSDTIMTALSRLSESSKAVMSWDRSQRDNEKVGRHDGVYEVASRLLGERLFAHTSLQKSERSAVAELVSRKLDNF